MKNSALRWERETSRLDLISGEARKAIALRASAFASANYLFARSVRRAVGKLPLNRLRSTLLSRSGNRPDARERITHRAMPTTRASSARRTPRGIIQSARAGTAESFEKRVLRDFRRRLLADGIYDFGDEPPAYTTARSLSPLYHSNFTPGRTNRFEAH